MSSSGLTLPGLAERGNEATSNHDQAAGKDGQLPASVIGEVRNQEEADDRSDIEGIAHDTWKPSSRSALAVNECNEMYAPSLQPSGLSKYSAHGSIIWETPIIMPS